jgi:DNA-binding transcriptional LysR family regulator
MEGRWQDDVAIHRMCAMDQLAGVFDELMALVEVVEAGGFNAASARSGVPVSRLSRRVSALEKHMGVSLLMRNSRRFKVTEVGWRTYEHGLSIRAQMQSTMAEARESLGEPSGSLRVSCPMALAAAIVGPLAIRFMRQFPRVSVTLDSTDGRARAFSDSVDVLIQPALQPLQDSSLVARKLVDAHYVLVAAPEFRDRVPRAPTPADFPAFPAIGWTFAAHPTRWSLMHPDLGTVEVVVDVRFATDNLILVREAALAGVGVAQLPPVSAETSRGSHVNEATARELVFKSEGWMRATRSQKRQARTAAAQS